LIRGILVSKETYPWYLFLNFLFIISHKAVTGSEEMLQWGKPNPSPRRVTDLKGGQKSYCPKRVKTFKRCLPSMEKNWSTSFRSIKLNWRCRMKNFARPRRSRTHNPIFQLFYAPDTATWFRRKRLQLWDFGGSLWSHLTPSYSPLGFWYGWQDNPPTLADRRAGPLTARFQIRKAGARRPCLFVTAFYP